MENFELHLCYSAKIALWGKKGDLYIKMSWVDTSWLTVIPTMFWEKLVQYVFTGACG